MKSADVEVVKMIRLKKISKSFGTKEVLKDITLDIKPGEILGLIRKNGAGKSWRLGFIIAPKVHRSII